MLVLIFGTFFFAESLSELISFLIFAEIYFEFFQQKHYTIVKIGFRHIKHQKNALHFDSIPHINSVKFLEF